MSQQRAKKNKEDVYTDMKIEGILERGKRLVDKINSNLYPEFNCNYAFTNKFKNNKLQNQNFLKLKNEKKFF